MTQTHERTHAADSDAAFASLIFVSIPMYLPMWRRFDPEHGRHPDLVFGIENFIREAVEPHLAYANGILLRAPSGLYAQGQVRGIRVDGEPVFTTIRSLADLDGGTAEALRELGRRTRLILHTGLPGDAAEFMAAIRNGARVDAWAEGVDVSGQNQSMIAPRYADQVRKAGGTPLLEPLPLTHLTPSWIGHTDPALTNAPRWRRHYVEAKRIPRTPRPGLCWFNGNADSAWYFDLDEAEWAMREGLGVVIPAGHANGIAVERLLRAAVAPGGQR